MFPRGYLGNTINLVHSWSVDSYSTGPEPQKQKTKLLRFQCLNI